MKKALFSLVAYMAILAPVAAQASQPNAAAHSATVAPADWMAPSPFAAVQPNEVDPFDPFTIFPPNA